MPKMNLGKKLYVDVTNDWMHMHMAWSPYSSNYITALHNRHMHLIHTPQRILPNTIMDRVLVPFRQRKYILSMVSHVRCVWCNHINHLTEVNADVCSDWLYWQRIQMWNKYNTTTRNVLVYLLYLSLVKCLSYLHVILLWGAVSSVGKWC